MMNLSNPKSITGGENYMNNFPVGVSLSHRHLEKLNIPIDHAWREYKKLNLKWIRLGCYWDEIERSEGKYDYRVIEELLEICSGLNINVIMTIGMKAPRWPEFYIPPYLSEKSIFKKHGTIGISHEIITGRLFPYIENTVKKLRSYPQIRYWQVENEPLDQSGPLDLKISPELLRRESEIVRTSDPNRPQIINLWGNQLSKRNNYSEAAKSGDVVGLDIYPRVPSKSVFKKEYYMGPEDSDDEIKNIIASIRESGKPVWITELQSEPWGGRDSCREEHVVENAKRARKWEADGIFFWGFEYWIGESLSGNDSYMQAAREACEIISSL